MSANSFRQVCRSPNINFSSRDVDDLSFGKSTELDERATNSVGSGQVGGCITDENRTLEIEVKIYGCLKQQARCGLAAAATFVRAVRAIVDRVDARTVRSKSVFEVPGNLF